MNKITEEKDNGPGEDRPGPKPNEHGGFYFSSSVKITDPNTKEVIVEMRGDN